MRFALAVLLGAAMVVAVGAIVLYFATMLTQGGHP